MTTRTCLAASLVLAGLLACGVASAAPSARRATPPPTKPEPMTFYVVKGAPHSCGWGCDSWIEAEGTIQADTAARFKTFLDHLKGRKLPIYFESPGGNLDQGVAMGNLLHARPSIARVGRSVVAECGFEAQNSDVCIKLKQSGRELHGSLLTRGAICGSACPYVFAGAAIHEVAPDALLAIHSPKVILNFHGGPVDPSLVAAANQRGRERADRLVSAYLAKVGIDAGLLSLTRTVKFEDIHVLTREEIARFGLDRRELAETPWGFERSAFSMIHKIAVARGPGETSFRLLQWRVVCIDTNRFALDFQRPATANTSLSTVSVVGDKPLYFSAPVKAGSFEQWGLRLLRPTLQSLLDRPEIEFSETSPGADGKRIPQTIKLSNEGWSGALESLVAVCPPAKNPVASQTVPTEETAAK